MSTVGQPAPLTRYGAGVHFFLFLKIEIRLIYNAIFRGTAKLFIYTDMEQFYHVSQILSVPFSSLPVSLFLKAIETHPLTIYL